MKLGERTAFPLTGRRAIACVAGTLLPWTAGCAELETLRQQTQLQEAEIGRLQVENAEYRKGYYQVNEARKTDAETFRARIEALENDLGQARRDRGAREKELNDKLNAKTLEAESLRVQLDDRISRATQELAEMTNAASRAEAQRSDLEKEYAELEAKITQLNTSLSQAAAERDETLKREQNLKTRLEGLEAQLGQMQSQQSSSEQMQEDLRKVKTELEKARADLEEARGEIDRLAAEIDKMRKQGLQPDPMKDDVLKSAQSDLRSRIKKFETAGGIEALLDARGLRVVLPTDSAFETGSVILSRPIQPILNEIAAVLETLSDRMIRIEGHTDDQPVFDLPFADNWGLGAARADRVRQYLIDEAELDPARVEMATRAQYDPIQPPKSAEDRAKNRRVEIVVSAK